jgi:hypothetical protein
MRPRILSALVLFGILGACGAKTSGLEGISCSADSDCNAGLKCLAYAVMVDGGGDGGCTSLGKVCVQPCTIDADCGSLDAGFTCSTGCNASAVCQPGQY